MALYLFSRGYNLNTDNWYSSPTLSEKLLGANKDVVGTLRLNRKNIPAKLNNQKLEKFYAVAMYYHKMMAEEWQDKRPVTILTVMYGNTGMVEQRKAGKQGNQSRNQSLSLTTTKVWGGGTEWTSSLYPTLSCTTI